MLCVFPSYDVIMLVRKTLVLGEQSFNFMATFEKPIGMEREISSHKYCLPLRIYREVKGELMK